MPPVLPPPRNQNYLHNQPLGDIQNQHPHRIHAPLNLPLNNLANRPQNNYVPRPNGAQMNHDNRPLNNPLPNPPMNRPANANHGNGIMIEGHQRLWNNEQNNPRVRLVILPDGQFVIRPNPGIF